jgi:hypothetical protein
MHKSVNCLAIHVRLLFSKASICAATKDFNAADGNYYLTSCLVKTLNGFNEASSVCNSNNMALLWLDPFFKSELFDYAATVVDATNKEMWIDDGLNQCSMMSFNGVFTIATKPCTQQAWSFCEYRKNF